MRTFVFLGAKPCNSTARVRASTYSEACEILHRHLDDLFPGSGAGSGAVSDPCRVSSAPVQGV
jgi:hypothetical protein